MGGPATTEKVTAAGMGACQTVKAHPSKWSRLARELNDGMKTLAERSSEKDREKKLAENALAARDDLLKKQFTFEKKADEMAAVLRAKSEHEENARMAAIITGVGAAGATILIGVNQLFDTFVRGAAGPDALVVGFDLAVGFGISYAAAWVVETAGKWIANNLTEKKMDKKFRELKFSVGELRNDFRAVSAYLEAGAAKPGASFAGERHLLAKQADKFSDVDIPLDGLDPGSLARMKGVVRGSVLAIVSGWDYLREQERSEARRSRETSLERVQRLD